MPIAQEITLRVDMKFKSFSIAKETVNSADGKSLQSMLQPGS